MTSSTSLAIISLVALFVAATSASPALKVVPQQIPEEIETFHIFWSGVKSPSTFDYIALYDYPTPQNRLPWATFNNTKAASSGSFKLDLLNWRTGYRFVYFSVSSTGVATPVAHSPVITANAMYPTQIHLSLTEKPSSMRVMWVSGATQGHVIFGYRSDLSDGVQVTGSHKTYSVDQMCGLNAAIYYLNPGNIFSAVMNNLKPNSLVYYKVVTKAGSSSQIMSFRTAPVPGADNSISMFAFGDSGVSKCQNMTGWCEPAAGQTYANIESDMRSNSNFSLLLHIGDISYAVGHANRWEQFFYEIKPMATRMPYMVCIGNHEYDYQGQPFKPSWGNYANDSYGECGIPYWSRFKMPGQNNQSLWYSFDYGNVHFTFMSSEHDCTPGSEQHAWLQQDLASVDRTVTPFVIFSAHRPMYTSEYYPANVTYMDGLRGAVEPLLLKYQVDLAMWGHVHSYERTCPVFNQKCTDGATTHVVIGMGGMNLTPAWATKPDWIVYRDINFGYSRIFTTPNTLHFQYVKDNGQVIGDEFTLARRF